MFTRIDHISVTVKDSDYSCQFYQMHFGFAVLFHDVIPQGPRISYLMLGNTMLELVEQKEGEIINTQHFCLHTDNFLEDYQSLITKKVILWRAMHSTAARKAGEENWKRAVFLGPDHEHIEIRG